ncbi:MAG: MBL fold metallo-hydrolase [Clostridiales bacterium]|nr:MBL fold metallo-hydrolase [Clostridiales bacterium]
MTLTMLGTGNALVTEVYNTCFVINNGGSFFMVDGGGGNTVLSRLKHAGFNWMDMKNIFVTHKHLDHIMGIIWMIRMICQYMNEGKYEGDAAIYGHDEVITILKNAADTLLRPKETRFIGDRLRLVTVNDGEKMNLCGMDLTFFDIHSTKAKQFGFKAELPNGKVLTCCGDEPCDKDCFKYALNSDWLLHEAFCLFSDADIFGPYKKHHSTAKDASVLANELNVKNLLLYHTEDSNITERKKLYTAEAEEHFSGNVFVPDDLETIVL